VGEDEAYATLVDVAERAESAADEQRQVARQARQAARQARRGATWSDLTDSGVLPSIWRSLSDAAGQLAQLTGALRSAVARALVAEGLTTRQIGQRFGVSHQRISALLSRQAQ
jgi:predicted XRE-type DNA-binding protein